MDYDVLHDVLADKLDFRTCEGCGDYERHKMFLPSTCDIVFNHHYLFDKCPCKTCIVKAMCNRACKPWQILVYGTVGNEE